MKCIMYINCSYREGEKKYGWSEIIQKIEYSFDLE